jgi:hypothetical protein
MIAAKEQLECKYKQQVGYDSAMDTLECYTILRENGIDPVKQTMLSQPDPDKCGALQAT